MSAVIGQALHMQAAVEKKYGFILSMKNLTDALMKMASVVAGLAPTGIFTLSAAPRKQIQIKCLYNVCVICPVRRYNRGFIKVFTDGKISALFLRQHKIQVCRF